MNKTNEKKTTGCCNNDKSGNSHKEKDVKNCHDKK